MPVVRLPRACDRSASPAVQVPAEGDVCFSHQSPVCPVSHSIAPVGVTLTARRPWVANVTVSIGVVHVLLPYAA